MCVSDWCFMLLSTIFQSYHDSGCLLNETPKCSGFKCCQHWCIVPQTQDKSTRCREVPPLYWFALGVPALGGFAPISCVQLVAVQCRRHKRLIAPTFHMPFCMAYTDCKLRCMDFIIWMLRLYESLRYVNGLYNKNVCFRISVNDLLCLV